jgi:Flp pilus assembly pilin Flp
VSKLTAPAASRLHAFLSTARTRAEAYLPEREEGQGMIEYGLIIALISIAAIALLLLFKDPLVNLFSNALSSLKA